MDYGTDNKTVVIVMQRVGTDVIIYHREAEYKVNIELLIKLIQLCKSTA